MPTTAVQDYLKALHALGGAEGMVPPVDIAARLGVETLLATECGMEDGRYIGRSVDVPCFQEGKVVRLERWLAENGLDLQGSWFYSDSRNDLPLLLRVSNPVAVDPDAVLRAEAEARGWPVISLR